MAPLTSPWRDAQVSPSDFPVLRHHQTRWMDNDAYGHLNNVVYYSLIDSTVNGWLMEATGTDVRELPVIGVVAETSCRYLSELSFPDQLQIGLALERRGNRSVAYRLAVFRQDLDGVVSNRPSAVARFVHVYVERRSRRPTAIPPIVGEALSALDGFELQRRQNPARSERNPA